MTLCLQNGLNTMCVCVTVADQEESNTGYGIHIASTFFLNIEFNTFSATVRVCGHAPNWIELLRGSRERGKERANERKKGKKRVALAGK